MPAIEKGSRSVSEKKPCIFCGQHGNKSKEHFYPAWLSNHIDGTGINNVSKLVTKAGTAPEVFTRQFERQGHLITKKLRVVCQTCNNGWMNQIESSVKDILLAGVNRTHLSPSRDRQQDLATWVCLKSIVSEYSFPGLASTPSIDRHAFYTDRKIPDYFQIYFVTHAASFETGMCRHSITASLSKTIDPPLLDGLRRNTQTVTFVLGHHVFHVLAARVSKFDMTYPGLNRLWPPDNDQIDTRGLRALNALQIDQVGASLEQYLAANKARYVTPFI